MAERGPEIVLVRHGETEWNRSGQHTGRTDIGLTPGGRRQAERIGARLGQRPFDLVLTSPLRRAADTCRLAGLGVRTGLSGDLVAERRDDLMEWDYGDYEGRTTDEIRSGRPGWSLWTDGAPGGETASEVGARADKVIAELATAGDVAVFSHGHLLRVLAARWIGLAPSEGACLALDTASVSVLGHERETPVLRSWNQECDA